MTSRTKPCARRRRRRRVGGILAVSVVAVAAYGSPASAATGTSTWRSRTLDGIVQARPAVVGNVVVVATENNSLYGLSLGDGHVVWGPQHLGRPVSRSAIASLSPAASGCGNIDPLGITGSPVVDTSTPSPRVFAVAEVLPTVGRAPVHELVGVDAATGRVVVGPTPIDPPGMTHPEVQQQRAGLGLGNGMVYVGFGGLYGDCGDYYGFVVAAKADGTGVAGVFEAGGRGAANVGGAVWGTSALPVDSAGHVYAATGNASASPTDPATDYSDGVVRLGASAGTPLDYFQPSSWRADNASDADLGSTGPLLLDGRHLFQVGKQQRAFLLDVTNLGGANHHTPVASVDVCTAFGATASLGTSVFVPCQDGVQQVLVDLGSSPRLRRGWTAPVHANGPVTVGAGVVWSVDTSDATLYGLAPRTGHVVARHPIPLDPSQHFPTPTVAGTRVIVEAGASIVSFGLPKGASPAAP